MVYSTPPTMRGLVERNLEEDGKRAKKIVACGLDQFVKERQHKRKMRARGGILPPTYAMVLIEAHPLSRWSLDEAQMQASWGSTGCQDRPGKRRQMDALYDAAPK